MGFIIFVIFLSLVFSLFFSKLKKGKLGQLAKLFRIASVVFAVSVFTYWFIKKSVIGVVSNSLSLQVINKLPQPLDFYVINVNNLDKNTPLETKHIGKIRPEYYRVEYLKMTKSDEYWVAGYLGKKNLVYFSQHSVPNKNMDQMIEVQNYINQSEKLSAIAKKEIEEDNYQNMLMGIWVTLCFLLLFLNFVLLVRKK
ncbi:MULTISPECIES: hypothetical protein [Chryseobacterium]|uniref:Uncharacterized protein n=1 Tax=Chryseobacterium scophthalmum TaxID=59733 RepID=A0A1N6I842_9FLAO|nr:MULTISPECIES: hypothetical protein [Chryseobacterium]MBM7419139.1 hypothetical protein [Chryseobacterium sp. JUb44]MDH6209062.1 hypothetical protein [Chryseobacterium sp. BIGb0186]WSO11914.1 hypothetical protein VUJ64_08415 [Chryseobacterium scophthalmum]SIO28187.1 hypothetical protein SAMN05421769_3116 [Chryseobacterium scophthalmum]VXC54932.1 conserved membrane hypothetical protein [Chryseobacterium sp. 8AT]